MTRPVVVGLDGFPESRAAAEWGAAEALLRGAPLSLVHVEEWLIPAIVELPTSDREGHREWADDLLEEAVDDLRQRHPLLNVTSRRLTGRTAAALGIEAAGAQLLVLGSRGLGTVTGFLLGSTTMATIGVTDTPVVLVRASTLTEADPERSAHERGVIVGVDIHETGASVLEFAFDEAARRGCGLRAVHGWTLPFAFGYAPMLDPGVIREVAGTVGRRLGDVMQPWRQRYPTVKVEERALVGAPAEQVLCEAEDADLVVVGRRIRRPPVGGHLGHVAHAVIHHATVPVAVIAHD
ncbi:universal stress protein [Streptomyces sp. SCSIO 30461]|uniref:universal stress protein n=1 Tax=Streptomyces sp. SCSIO 30461 TaxID=3118085 RepID=UPI0030CBA442